MKVINQFLQEDLLVVKPSLFIYVDKDKVQQLTNSGMNLDKDYISCYLTRIPSDNVSYRQFLEKTVPVRITLSKLKRINDQKVKLIAVNINMVSNPDNEIKLSEEEKITELVRKYDSYLNVCYKDNVPLDNIPHVDLYLSKKFLPGFVCKTLSV